MRESANSNKEYQTVARHLTGTAELCRGFAAAFGADADGELAGLAHDIGKCTEEFQNRLLNDGPIVDHATAGAMACAVRGSRYVSACVAGHHGGLPDFGNMRTARKDDGTFYGRLLKGRDEQCLGRCGDSGVTLPPPTVSAAQKLTPLQASFWMRMLYSCLVDADFLDTERFMNGDPGRGGYDDIPTLLARLQAYIEPWQQPKTELNRLRCEILNACLSAGSKPKGIYTLTVPTGGGKTVASLAFALRHAAEHRMQRVIYAIQYGVMQACGGTEAIPAALQLSLLVNTQHIRRVIPQEVGSNANSALYRRRQDYRLWTQDCLFTHRYFFHSGDRLRHLTAFIQTQGKADLCRAPAGSGDLAALEKILVIPRQRLQDHLLTSSLSHGGTTITPSVRLARKNRGVMVCGSL